MGTGREKKRHSGLTARRVKPSEISRYSRPVGVLRRRPLAASAALGSLACFVGALVGCEAALEVTTAEAPPLVVVERRDASSDALPPTVCGPGADVLGSNSEDACAPCPSGSFSAMANAAQCVPWSVCEPGTYVVAKGSATADQSCAACPEGFTSDAPNQEACVPPLACPAGTARATSSEGKPSCASCEPGTFCPGGDIPKEPCGAGTWDHDSSAMTACIPWTPCAPGQRILAVGSPTTDRTCVACASGSASTSTNASACIPWTDCAPASYVSAPGTSASDRQCAPCAPGTFSTVTNQAACLPKGACPPGQKQATAATDITDAVCVPCAVGMFCAGGEAPETSCPLGTWDDDQNSATECIVHTNCLPGQKVFLPGTNVSDRLCVQCASGSFSVTENAAACTPWTACSPWEFLTSPGTSTSDQTCSAEGVILAYDAAVAASYPGSGTVLTNLVSASNHGTLVNGVGFSAGAGGALVFDGVNDYVSTGDVIRGRTAITVEVWIKTSDTRTGSNGSYHNPSICGTQHGSGLSGDFALTLKAGRLGFFHELNGSGAYVDTGVSVADNTWKHVVLTKSTAGAIVIYVNGAQIYSGTGFTAAFRTSDLQYYGWELGRAYWYGEDASMLRYAGQIAAHTLYTTPLTAAQVLDKFNARRARFGL